MIQQYIIWYSAQYDKMEVCVDLGVIKINSTLYDTVHNMIKWKSV